jgi:PIN domain nuclease of toxin-antitoxin system
MKLLLDTHTLLWSLGKTNELSQRALKGLKDVNNDIFVSAISLWEIALKYSIGKLIIEEIDIKDISEYCENMGFELISLDPILLKENHKDPFDRMLIYQCIKGNYTLLSKDAKLKYYKSDRLQYIW